MRLTGGGFRPAAAPVRVRFDGREIEALPGETIAASLAASGITSWRRTRSGAPRGAFCGMGVCFDCLVSVDGLQGQRACLTRVAAGMDIRSEPTFTATKPTQPAPVTERSCDVLVIGAGPAGLSAARRTAASGASVIVLDERHEPGGQYFKPPAKSHAASRLDRQFRRGASLRELTIGAGAEILTDALAWAAFSPTEIAAIVDGRSMIFRPRRLVLATGAYEQAVPVPGWTLPGVMTVGGLQTLARAYRVAPGNRIVIAGNGPLCLQTAVELADGGAKVVAVVEAARRPRPAVWPALLRAAVAAPELAVDGARMLYRLRQAGVPVIWGDRVTRILGTDHAQGIRTLTAEHAADIVALNYGFAASSELARALGCAHHFVPRGIGSMETIVDAEGRTSLSEVFAIGDGARFGGAQAAQAEGEIAAAAICHDLGWPVAAAMSGAARARMAKAGRFQAALWQAFAAAPYALELAEDATLICRCEEVSAGALRRLIAEGHDSPAALKRMCRVGMGRCQGRYCAAAVARLCGGGDSEIGEFGLFAPRPPAKPVPVRALAFEQAEWGGHREVVPPDVSRPRERSSLPTERVDTVVIGGGIMGCCLAYFLARDGIETLVLERDDLNLQASGANAGSLHVQLLSFDFGDKAQAGGGPAADTLPLGPASVRLWQEIASDVGDDLELRITGGLMLAETEKDIAFLRDKIALERRSGIETGLIGANELRDLEPAVGASAIAAELCPLEGKINPLKATFAVAARARELGARFRRGSDVQAIERQGALYCIRTSRGEVRCGRIVNAAGPWAPQIAGLLGLALPVQGAPLQMLVTEPAPHLLDRLVAHADRHLTLKQMASGAFVIGGGWTAGLDLGQKLSRPLRASVEGNLWVAARAVPALADLHVVRIWAAMNVNIDRAPIIGEAAGLPGFYNCVSSNGYTLAPVLARLTSEIIAGRSPSLPVGAYSLDRFRRG